MLHYYRWGWSHLCFFLHKIKQKVLIAVKLLHYSAPAPYIIITNSDHKLVKHLLLVTCWNPVELNFINLRSDKIKHSLSAALYVGAIYIICHDYRMNYKNEAVCIIELMISWHFRQNLEAVTSPSSLEIPDLSSHVDQQTLTRYVPAAAVLKIKYQI